MTKILKVFGTNLRISGPFHSVPLEWFAPSQLTYSKKLLRVIETKSAEKSLKLNSFVSTVTVVMLWIQVIHGFLRSSYNDPKNSSILPFGFVLLLTASNVYFHICRMKRVQIAELINGFIQFEDIYPILDARKTFDLPIVQLFGILFARVMFLTQFVVPIGAVFGMHFKNSEKPSLAGYWLIPSDKSDWQNEIMFEYSAVGIKLGILLYNYWIWSFLNSSSCFVCGLIHNLCITTLLDCIQM